MCVTPILDSHIQLYGVSVTPLYGVSVTPLHLLACNGDSVKLNIGVDIRLYGHSHIHFRSLRHNERRSLCLYTYNQRWGPGVETQKTVRGVFGGWGRVPFNETYAPSISTIYDGA